MDNALSAYIRSELARLDEAGLRRSLPPVDRGAERHLLHEGRPLLNLGSNNYLGLACDPAVAEAAARAARDCGAGSGASPLVAGRTRLHDELEARLAAFHGREAALVLGSGFAANLAVLAAFAPASATVFSDRLNHASILDGVRLSGARHVRYRHNDPEHLAQLLDRHAGPGLKLVVTDSVFSMDGDAADLASLAGLCKRSGAALVVDEAHACGVLGQGRGLAHALGLADEVDLHVGTLSKALGSCGGYVAGSREAMDLLASRGRSFIFSTAPPPAAMAAALAALDRIEADPAPAARLLALADRLRAALRGLGFDTGASSTQIVPVLLGRADLALRARDLLRERGVFVPAIRPPAVPPGTARLRVSLRADLTGQDMDLAEAAFAHLAREIPG